MEEEVVPVGIATETTVPAVTPEPNATIVPLLGIVVNLDNPTEVAKAMQAVRQAKRQLDEVRADLERVLVEEAARQGTKTLHLDGGDVVITGGPTVEYDIEILQELQEVGLPEERYDKLVKARVEYIVDKSVIRQLVGSGNEDYVRIIEKAKRVVEKTYYARNVE